MVAKRCLICCGESYPKKTGTQDASSASSPSAENFNYCQQAVEGTDNGDTELQIIFLLRKLLEIPEENKLRDRFGNASVWIECCDSCLDLVEKCKTALEQAELFQKQYEELRSNIKTTMLKSPKKPFSAESKCEAIVRSHLITQEIDNFLNATVVEADEEIFSDENVNCDINILTAPVRCQDTPALIGSLAPVLFERIKTVKTEDDITFSFNEKDDMDFNMESSDILNNIQSDKTFVCIREQNNFEKIPTDDVRKSKNHNLDQFIVSAKPNESSRGSKSSLNTAEEEEPAFSKRDDKGDAEKKHECHICFQLFKLPQELKAHLRFTHSSTEPDTNAVTKRKEISRNQPTKQTAEKKHKCDICGKSFREFYNLKIHRRIHSGEKPFECDICGKNFTAASSLNVHYRLHSGEKPFQCGVCGKSFITKSNLTAHQMTHIEKKPFKCDTCDKSFKWKSNLTQHLQIHD